MLALPHSDFLVAANANPANPAYSMLALARAMRLSFFWAKIGFVGFVGCFRCIATKKIAVRRGQRCLQHQEKGSAIMLPLLPLLALATGAYDLFS